MRLRVRQRTGRGANHIRQNAPARAHPEAASVFGQLARGPGKIAGSDAGFTSDHRQARRGQGAGHRALQAGRGFQRDEGRVADLELGHSLSPLPLASLGTAAHRSPEGRRAISSWALATSIPTKQGASLIQTPCQPEPCRYGLYGAKQLYGLAEVQDVTTRAALRPQRTKAESVYHVRVLRDGDAPRHF